MPAPPAAPPAVSEAPVLTSRPPAAGNGEPTRIAPRRNTDEDVVARADAKPTFSIPFNGEATEVADSGRNRLRDLARQMANDPRMRVEIFAYASGTDDSASKARRVSLLRGLSVRGMLLEEGIRPERINVHTLGNQSTKQPADRVDVMTSGPS